MTEVVGVRFQNTGKSYYFDPLEFTLRRGMHVIVETAAGEEFGSVTIPPISVQDEKVVKPLRPVIRIATERDERINAENKEKSIEAGKICVEKIAKHGLEMKLVDTEYTFDRSKLMFYFTADGRVDFRELVKELASIFRTRIELRQIGVRDETKIKGGMGMCGRELCCTTFLSDFAPVSIRMAKEQNLSLNPSKISGTCGRLMCCLKNEQETYEYLNKQLPKTGTKVRTIDGNEGTVQNVNILKQTVKVVLDVNGEKEIREYASGEVAYGDKDFTCEPRRQEDDLDYFSEQLKKAVAASQSAADGQRKEENGDRKRGKGRSHHRSKAGQDGAQHGDGKQDGSEKQRGRQQDSERKKNADRQNGDQKQRSDRKKRSSRQDGREQNGEQKQHTQQRQDGERKQRTQRQDGEQKSGAQKRRRNDQRRNQKQQAEGRVNPEENRNKAQTSGRDAGKAGGEDTGRGADEKSGRSRNRNRNRYRGNKNTEGKQQQGDAAGTKQSDS